MGVSGDAGVGLGELECSAGDKSKDKAWEEAGRPWDREGTEGAEGAGVEEEEGVGGQGQCMVQDMMVCNMELEMEGKLNCQR